jgi:uncharacterized membrane protein (Fun14 family)
MNSESLSSVAATMGSGFFEGVLIGYALKKVVKRAAVVVGLFLAGLAYFQYQQILNINWNKLQVVSQNTLSILANATTHIPGFNRSSDHVASLAFTNVGVPFTGSVYGGLRLDSCVVNKMKFCNFFSINWHTKSRTF